MVVLAIRNGAYGADEEFAKLPEDVQRAIGGSHYIHELALSQDVNWGVESSNFFRNLRVVRERIKNVENIPDAVKNLIDQMSQAKQAQLENKQEVARLEQKNYYDDLSERTMEKFLTEDRGELTDGQKGFADMLRERLGMPKKEEPSADEYSAEYYYDPSQDNKEDGWEGDLFA
jgi:superfamily I DNA/RNA helicase